MLLQITGFGHNTFWFKKTHKYISEFLLKDFKNYCCSLQNILISGDSETTVKPVSPEKNSAKRSSGLKKTGIINFSYGLCEILRFNPQNTGKNDNLNAEKPVFHLILNIISMKN